MITKTTENVIASFIAILVSIGVIILLQRTDLLGANIINIDRSNNNYDVSLQIQEDRINISTVSTFTGVDTIDIVVIYDPATVFIDENSQYTVTYGNSAEGVQQIRLTDLPQTLEAGSELIQIITEQHLSENANHDVNIGSILLNTDSQKNIPLLRKTQ